MSRSKPIILTALLLALAGCAGMQGGQAQHANSQTGSTMPYDDSASLKGSGGGGGGGGGY